MMVAKAVSEGLLADARTVIGLIRAMPGATAVRLARAWDPCDGGFQSPPGVRIVNARQIRRLVFVARRDLAAAIIPAAGGKGYCVADRPADVLAHCDVLERFGRDYFALAAILRRAAEKLAGGQAALFPQLVCKGSAGE